MQSLPKRKGQDLNQLLKKASPDCIDLIRKMLTFDPNQRCSVQQAIEHKWFEKLHSETEEPVEKEMMAPFDFDFELYSLSTNEFKQLVYEEIELYHSEEAVNSYLKNRQEHPNGVLFQRYGKERMRTMYKTGEAPPTEHK